MNQSFPGPLRLEWTWKWRQPKVVSMAVHFDPECTHFHLSKYEIWHPQPAKAFEWSIFLQVFVSAGSHPDSDWLFGGHEFQCMSKLYKLREGTRRYSPTMRSIEIGFLLWNPPRARLPCPSHTLHLTSPEPGSNQQIINIPPITWQTASADIVQNLQIYHLIYQFPNWRGQTSQHWYTKWNLDIN